MRKFILIAFILCFGLLKCSDKNSHQIAVWHSMRPEGRKILTLQLQKFRQQLIERDSVRFSKWGFTDRFYAPEEARTNFIISALAGKGPALFRGASDNIGPLVELAVIRPMEPYFEQAYLDSFISEPIPAVVEFRGHVYQIADEVGNHLCLVYNRDIVPKPPQTINELISMGKQLLADSDSNHPELRYALAWNFTEPFFAVPFIGGYGGWILNAQNQPTLNNQAVVNAVQLIYDLAHKHQIIPKECDYETANALFIEGSSAMIINGPWSWGSYLDKNIPIGIARIPMIDATGLWPAPLVSPLGYSMNVNLKGEELALTVELLKFLTSPENELEYTRAFGAIPSRKEAMRSPDVTENTLLNSSIDQLEVGKPMPVVTELRWIWDAMRPGYQAIFTGEMTPGEAAASMQKLAEKLIKENRE